MEEKYIKMAYDEAVKGYNCGEVPVGCVIVYDDKVIARAHNLKELLNDATCHAEILAIREASKFLGDWRLDGCSIYTTVEPCEMCMGAIRESRISRVIFAVNSSNLKKYYKPVELINTNIEKDNSLNLLKSFFEEKRK